MSANARAFAFAVVSIAIVTDASALPNATANCRTVMDEKEYKTGGGRLIEVGNTNLKFPKGFFGLSCEGHSSERGVVQEDGSVRMLGADGSVHCANEGGTSITDAMDKSLWRAGVIDFRFRKMRFQPPSMNGVPVCVRIWRYYLPYSHRFVGGRAE